MAKSNTNESETVDPSDQIALSPKEQAREQEIKALQEAMDELGIDVSLMIFRFPEDEDGSFRTIRSGHFYDSLQMISEYCRRAKQRISQDLDGIA